MAVYAVNGMKEMTSVLLDTVFRNEVLKIEPCHGGYFTAKVEKKNLI